MLPIFLRSLGNHRLFSIKSMKSKEKTRKASKILYFQKNIRRRRTALQFLQKSLNREGKKRKLRYSL